MRIEQYFILSAITSLMPVFGYLISLYVKEELKDFRRYLPFIKFAIIFFLLGVFVTAKLSPWLLILVVFCLIFLEIMKSEVIFFVLGILFFVSCMFWDIAPFGIIGIAMFGLFFGIGIDNSKLMKLYLPSVLLFFASSAFFILRILLQ